MKPESNFEDSIAGRIVFGLMTISPAVVWCGVFMGWL